MKDLTPGARALAARRAKVAADAPAPAPKPLTPGAKALLGRRRGARGEPVGSRPLIKEV